jgi:hypothetical protein
MLYDFYGQNIVINYKAVKRRNPYDYSIPSYDLDVVNKEVSWTPFHTKATDIWLNEGDVIEINGAEVIIQKITLDLDNERYKCYTNIVICEVSNKKAAEYELQVIKEKDKTFLGKIKEFRYNF